MAIAPNDIASVRTPVADRILYWPFILSVGWPIVLILVWSGPFGLIFACAPLVALSWALSTIMGLIFAAIRAYQRAWRQALSSMVLPLTGLLAGWNIAFVWGMAATAGDELHVFVMRPSYLREISSLPSGEPRLMVFDWGGFGAVEHAAVYDESDEIALPARQRSEAWKKRADRTDAECPVLGLAPAGGHFYIVRLDC